MQQILWGRPCVTVRWSVFYNYLNWSSKIYFFSWQMLPWCILEAITATTALLLLWKSQLSMSVGVKVKGAIEMLWIIIKIHEKALQGRTGTSWEMVCSQPAGKAEDRMLIEMLFLKITMTSTFISSALCRSCLYNWDCIRCDEQMCSREGLCCVGEGGVGSKACS